jgi:hypothetical protein
MMGVAVGVEFAAAALLAPRHGVGAKFLRRAALSLRIVREDALGMLYRSKEVRPGSALPVRIVIEGVGGGLLARAAVGGLRRTGRIEDDGAGVRLTPRGEEEARRLVRGHRLWETYLARHLDLPLDHLHEPSERMEHYITPELRAGLGAELAAPTDPMGKRIPSD